MNALYKSNNEHDFLPMMISRPIMSIVAYLLISWFFFAASHVIGQLLITNEASTTMMMKNLAGSSLTLLIIPIWVLMNINKARIHPDELSVFIIIITVFCCYFAYMIAMELCGGAI